ncbi:hypothetical protein R3P38DRAFT_3374388 [Favolaschia claudopus]|uniref:Uncharacterized protein n=1 Tax=Favolaschia claudopus TaxID=2862362 RepID=A0AAV9ZNM4_9AGAR
MATTIISRKAQRKQATNSAPAPSPETIGTIAPIGSAVTDDGDPPSSRGRRRTKAVPTPDDVGDSHAIQASMPGALAQSSFYSHVAHTPTVVTGQLRSASWTPYQYTRSDTPDGAVDTAKLYTSAWQHVDHNEAREGSLIQERKFPMLTTPRKRRLTGKLSRRREKLSKQPGSTASAESRSQNYAWPGAQQLGPSALSPYPSSVLNEYSGSSDDAVMSDGQRAMRRSEKDRAVDSSPHKGGPAIALDKEHKQMAFTEEDRRRREQFVLGMNKLRDLRVNDDLQAQDQEEFSRRVLEIQRETAEEDEKARVLEETARTAYEVACAQRQKAEQRKKSAVAQLATAVDQKKVRMDFTPPKADAAAPKRKVEYNSLYGVGKPVPWHDRVVFQRLRRQMLKENGYSGYIDMNIGFDAKDEPIEIGPAPIQTPNWSGWDLNATPPAKRIRAEGQAEAMGEGKSTTPVNPQAKKEKKAKKAEPSDGGESSSDSDSSSRASSRKKSKKNRRSYRSDSNYSRSETTDSAFGESSDSERDSRKKRKKRRNRDSSPSDSSGDSSSSSNESSDESSNSDDDHKK